MPLSYVCPRMAAPESIIIGQQSPQNHPPTSAVRPEALRGSAARVLAHNAIAHSARTSHRCWARAFRGSRTEGR